MTKPNNPKVLAKTYQNYHKFASRLQLGLYPLYSPFLHYDHPHLSATSPSTTPSSFVVPSQQSAPACVRWWGHRPILWALTDDPTTPQGSDSSVEGWLQELGGKNAKKKKTVCSGVDLSLFWLKNLNGFFKNKMVYCIRYTSSKEFIVPMFSTNCFFPMTNATITRLFKLGYFNSLPSNSQQVKEKELLVEKKTSHFRWEFAGDCTHCGCVCIPML